MHKGFPWSRRALKTVVTLPRLLRTLPYRHILKRQRPAARLLDATNIFSAHNFVAPYKLSGLTALSVDKAITFLTPAAIAALQTFSLPITLVITASNGLYSHEGTILRAAV